MLKPIIVAVDGHAGSGKSSICARVCERIGWIYINTGALYRAVAVLSLDAAIDTADEAAVLVLTQSFVEQARWDAKSQRLWYGERDLTPTLGSVRAGNEASRVARLATVRDALLPLQRRLTLSAMPGALVDGRDIGTVVFPDADLKLFFTAGLEERARRRLDQLASGWRESPHLLDEMMRDIAGRDRQDEARGQAPLKRASDAVEIDTGRLSFEDSIKAVITLLKDRGLLV